MNLMNFLKPIEMNKTAVEYLIEQLLPKSLSAEQYYYIEKSKEMEKQQITMAFWDGKYLNLNSQEYYNFRYKNKKDE